MEAVAQVRRAEKPTSRFAVGGSVIDGTKPLLPRRFRG